MYRQYFLFLVFVFVLSSCSDKRNSAVPVIGFLDLLEDETLAQARKGFFVALKDHGFSPKDSTLEIIYRNAQNDQTTLIQACEYLISRKVALIATNPTLSTITTIQRTSSIPVFMMVSPRPDIAGLTDAEGYAPVNLFGVYESLDYIDTSFLVMHSLVPGLKKIGLIYNQSEPQSVDALQRIESAASDLGLKVEKQSVNSSNETQLAVASLLNKKIDAFFALPDNSVFASMEVIVKSCDDAKVPVFTSEEGLVRRGAIAAFGADMYQWGYQSGVQAAKYLSNKSLKGIQPEMVHVRRKVYNIEKSNLFNLQFDSTFTGISAPGS